MSEPAAPRAELAVAAGWFAFGATAAVASWRMDRLSDRGIEPWSAPGLTPGLVGVLVMAIALVVGLRAWARRVKPGGAAIPASQRGPVLGRTILAGALCVAFAASLGHGLPFIACAAVFVFAFTAVFSWADWQRSDRVARGAGTALAVALVASAAIALLFEHVFLVRLP